ncbi:MAG: hypothetical protein IT542_00930, partial [Rubellimicrobium sp.]|nr:hypothetical protein [Rubellimicrobium sp.]
MDEFLDTSSQPVGHGFGLIDRSAEGADFACYSFVPNGEVPLKVIVLDVTQSADDGSFDIHGHGYLDRRRLEWNRAELAGGQADNQLMIIASHIPIGVSAIGSHVEWWAGDTNTNVDVAGPGGRPPRSRAPAPSRRSRSSGTTSGATTPPSPRRAGAARCPSPAWTRPARKATTPRPLTPRSGMKTCRRPR